MRESTKILINSYQLLLSSINVLNIRLVPFYLRFLPQSAIGKRKRKNILNKGAFSPHSGDICCLTNNLTPCPGIIKLSCNLIQNIFNNIYIFLYI